MRFSSSVIKASSGFYLVVILASAAVGQSTSNRKIAFSFGGGAASSAIAIINEDGSGQTQLTTAGFNDRNPTWSPDGTQIAFDSNRYGPANIFRMNADGTGQVPLTDSLSPIGNFDPAWSPDGTKILFASNRNGERRSEIWVMNADGTNPIRLTSNVQLGSDVSGPFYSQDRSPAWSPDSSKIVFSSTRDGPNPEIYSMNADGTNQTRLTNNIADDNEPAWSPDGQHIAFFSQGGGRIGIYVINIDGSNDQRLTDSGFQPAWSPDGLKVAVTDFDPQASYAYAIFLMSGDGSNRVRLTNNGLVDSSTPAWQTSGGPAPPPPPGPPVYSVSGRVVDTSISIIGSGVPGITISLNGTVSTVTTTDVNGRFFIGNLPENGTFTLTPSTTDWGLFPTSRSFTTSIPLIGFVGRNLDVQFDASPIFLQFISASFSEREGTNALITVERVGYLTGTSTIEYSTNNGSATAGSDFAPTTGTLRFNPSESLKSFSVPIIYDKAPEPNETINLTLTNPTGSISRGRQVAVLTISDPPPELITEANPFQAAALNAETWLRDPFSLTTTSFLGKSSATRVALFARFVDLLPTEDFSSVAVTAFDSQQRSYQLPTEFVGQVPGLDWLVQVNVTLPSNLTKDDLFVTISLRG